MWCPSGLDGEYPDNQQFEDGLCLSFTSARLEQPMEILGHPKVTLTVSVDQPNALLAVRLCDVAPSGESLLVTRGLLNLTHRHSHARPSLLEPGKEYTVTLRLNVVGHALPAGHRWRLAVSPNYWPHAWPSPKPVKLRVFVDGRSFLTLPVRPPRQEKPLPAFLEPEGAAPLETEIIHSPSRSWEIHHDVISGRYELHTCHDAGAERLLSNDIQHGGSYRETYTIFEDDPLSAYARCRRTHEIGRGDWRTRIETDSTMSSTETEFLITNLVEAFEGNTRIFIKNSQIVIPRDMV
jgi:hypothetical protein